MVKLGVLQSSRLKELRYRNVPRSLPMLARYGYGQDQSTLLAPFLSLDSGGVSQLGRLVLSSLGR